MTSGPEHGAGPPEARDADPTDGTPADAGTLAADPLDPDRLDALATGFSVLGRFHLTPPDAATLAEVWDLVADWPLPGTEEAAAGLAHLRAARAAAEDAVVIADDHRRLYGTAAAALVAPYESVHRSVEKLVFDAHTLQVRQAYGELGLQAPRLNREPDDHIGLELAFVGQCLLRALDALETGAPGEAARYVRLGLDFHRDHLDRWAPGMLAEAAGAARTEFMRGVARLSLGALREIAVLGGREATA